LLEWAEPVTYDRLRDACQMRLGAGDDAVPLARLHCRAWRRLIAGDEANCQRLRTERLAAIAHGGLEVAWRSRGDAGAMAELLDIVAMRFQHCRREASRCRLALFELAERLVAHRELA
jgi:hypothetical protein